MGVFPRLHEVRRLAEAARDGGGFVDYDWPKPAATPRNRTARTSFRSKSGDGWSARVCTPTTRLAEGAQEAAIASRSISETIGEVAADALRTRTAGEAATAPAPAEQLTSLSNSLKSHMTGSRQPVSAGVADRRG